MINTVALHHPFVTKTTQHLYLTKIIPLIAFLKKVVVH